MKTASSPRRLETPEILHALRIIPALGPASFSFARDDGTMIDRLLEPLSPDSIDRIVPKLPRRRASGGR